MTAEIAIVNRQAIALAADSAVSIGKKRVWKTANKLFSLGPVNDIAIMIYNAGDFVGIPWEVLVKMFRDQTGLTKFKTVRECEEAFFKFLDSTVLPPSSDSDLSIIFIILDLIDQLAPKPKSKSLAALQTHIDKALERNTNSMKDVERIKDVMPFNVFISKFRSHISDISRDSYGFRLTKPFMERLERSIYEFVSKRLSSLFMSGLVFAGFGSNQLLPYISHYTVDGRMKYNVRRKEFRQTRFWVKRRYDLSDKSSPAAYIIPFAQSDIFHLFMEGITTNNISFIRTLLKDVLKQKTESLVETFVPEGEKVVERQLQDVENDEITKNFLTKFREFRQEKLINPVLEVIRALPKEEMAATAEALVEITALRRKIGSNLESVGGPIDVAVISKGDGLVWLKRKHYFGAEQNGDFAVRKRLKLQGGHDV